MFEKHHRPGELEAINFAGTTTIFDPENTEAWLCISYDTNSFRNKFQKK